MNKKNVIIMVAVAIAFAGGGFFGGMKYGQGQKTAAFQQGIEGVRNGMGLTGRGTNSGGFVSGQILSKDATSITVKTNGGGSKIILLAGSTTIGKATTGTADDLTVGKEVVATGSANSDGSITALNIQINPTGTTPPGQPTP